jgi:hypothetical protein
MVLAGPTVIPTLASRSRLQRLQDLAWEHVHPPCQVTAELPLGLQSYQPDPTRPEPLALQEAPALSQRSAANTAQAPALELLLWLSLVLIDGAVALADLLAQSRRRLGQQRRRGISNADPRITIASPWLKTDLHPTGTA